MVSDVCGHDGDIEVSSLDPSGATVTTPSSAAISHSDNSSIPDMAVVNVAESTSKKPTPLVITEKGLGKGDSSAVGSSPNAPPTTPATPGSGGTTKITHAEMSDVTRESELIKAAQQLARFKKQQ